MSRQKDPGDGETVSTGPAEVRGYAFTGGERLSRASTSHSTAAHWSQAELLRISGSGPGGIGPGLKTA